MEWTVFDARANLNRVRLEGVMRGQSSRSTGQLEVWTLSEPDIQLRQAFGRLSIETWSHSFHDITAGVASWLSDIDAVDGLVTIFVRHTSASLTIQENADVDVRRDLLDSLDKFAPQNAGYRHSTEGPDDMPAHIKSMLTSTSLTVPVFDGVMDLGTWQALYLIEHRARNHHRTLTLAFQGAFA